MTVTETTSGFISPGGPSVGTLASSASATFNDAGTGNSQMTYSTFNTTSTSPLTLASSSSTGPNSPDPGPPQTAPVTFTTPYSLSNTIVLGLSTHGADVTFGVSAKATSAIPEPASILTMMIGLPLPLVGIAWLRRKRTAV